MSPHHGAWYTAVETTLYIIVLIIMKETGLAFVIAITSIAHPTQISSKYQHSLVASNRSEEKKIAFHLPGKCNVVNHYRLEYYDLETI